jgi:beta-galactosidase
LLLAGTSYRKGLALHGHTEIMYRLPGSFSHFRAVAGIDDAVRPSGKTRLVVRGDDNVLLDVVILGNDAPRNIELNVASVRRLTIVVDFADSLSAGNDLLLCNARLSK